MSRNREVPPMSRSEAKSQLSAAQIAARRGNALLSTGPRTPEGKAIGAMNAVTHGLCTHVAVLPGESVEEFQATLEGWVHELKPADSYERELVYNMVCASIALTRVRKADNAAVSARVRDAGAKWDDARAAGLEALIESIHANRIEAHEALLRRGDGGRWLIALERAGRDAGRRRPWVLRVARVGDPAARPPLRRHERPDGAAGPRPGQGAGGRAGFE
jgi:hypothetical protein